MRFINFVDEVENSYLNVDKIVTCYLQGGDGGYNLRITYALDTKKNFKTINTQPLEYKKAIKMQSLLLTYLADDMVKIIDIDEMGNIIPRLHI